MAYKIKDRIQMTFLPPVIDNYISPEDPVRVYDAFAEQLDFKELGISIEPYKAGAHEYYPRDMLKLIMYGYSYGIRTSRKLERACHHNLSFIWLMGNLKPDYRTIARFRTDHKEPIKKVLKECVQMCIELDLIEGNTIFIDGSSFRANASIKNTWTKERCEKRLKKISEHIDRLVDETEQLDHQEENRQSLVKVKKELADKTELKNKIRQISSCLKDTKKKSVNTIDSDCTKVKDRQRTHAGYNAQLVVDEKHGLIVNSESSNRNHDANQFTRQLKKASEVLGKKPKVAVADSGYHSLEDLQEVDETITVVMPSQRQVQKERRQPLSPFDKDNFKYDAAKDEYICPEGKPMQYQGTISRGRVYKKSRRRYYSASARQCTTCHHFGACTRNSRGRYVTRLEQENLKHRLETIYTSERGQKIYKLRKEKAELPFGHIKRNLQAGQFLLRGKPGTDAELGILSTCFNIARMITLIGTPALILRLNGP